MEENLPEWNNDWNLQIKISHLIPDRKKLKRSNSSENLLNSNNTELIY